jgi:ubiquinone/menaquinone biosynthesis C-methylase UbiE
LLKSFFQLLYHQGAGGYDLVAWLVSLGAWDEWVRCALPYLEGSPYLELGPGPGHLLYELAKRGARVAGLDESAQMVRLAQRRVRRLPGGQAWALRGRAQQLPFATGSFQQVIATFPPEFILEPGTLADVHRVLKPGGSLVCLPYAWFTSRHFPYSLLAGLFRVTGQAPPDPLAAARPFAARLQAAGFGVQILPHALQHSTVMVIRAKKE